MISFKPRHCNLQGNSTWTISRQVRNGFLVSKKKKKKYGTRSLSLQGEAASVDSATVEEYKAKFQDLLKEFNPSDIFNLDETGLFYKLLPNRTLCSEAKAKGTKSTKERVSVVLCTSYTQVKSCPHLSLGRQQSQEAFRGLTWTRLESST